MKIVFWQEALTEHQAYTFIALQSLVDEPIEFVVGQREIGVRKAQGWSAFNVSTLSVHELSGNSWWRRGVEIIKRNRDAIHIFNGMCSDHRFFLLLLYAQFNKVCTALITEPYADIAVSYFGAQPNWLDRIKQCLRPLKYKLTAGLLARRMKAVFCISSKAVLQFKELGFKDNQVFPYGYFVPASGSGEVIKRNRPNSSILRLVFVGSLIARKGLSTLLEAIRICRDAGYDVRLDIFGPGAPSVQFGEVEGVSFCGIIPFGKAQDQIRDYDMLVLPSLHDGWGVVVNEALLQGVPVLVSSECGSKALVSSSGAGEVFMANDCFEIAKLIMKICRSPDLLLNWHSAAIKYRETMYPAVAANYLHRCLEYSIMGVGNKPEAPWYTNAEGLNGY